MSGDGRPGSPVIAASEPLSLREGADGNDEGPQYRVTSDSRHRGHQVSELTPCRGLVTVISGLERWQALAIVAILHHPHGD